MKKRLALNFKDYTDIEVENVASVVAHNMTDNEYFPGAGEMAAEVQALHDQFIKAISEAGNKDLRKISLKNDVRIILIKKMKQLGKYVESEANGNETFLISSGFPLVEPVSEIVLGGIVDFKIMPGKSNGEIIMQVSRVPGAKAYMYQYTFDPFDAPTRESKWETIYGTRCRKVLTNLPLGAKGWFRMAAIGSHDQIVYSEVLWRFVA